MPRLYTVHAAALKPTELKTPFFLHTILPRKTEYQQLDQPGFQSRIKGKLQAYNRHNLTQNNIKITQIT